MNNATFGTLGFNNFDYYEDKDDISNHEANVQNVYNCRYSGEKICIYLCIYLIKHCTTIYFYISRRYLMYNSLKEKKIKANLLLEREVKNYILARRIQHHQISSPANAKSSSLNRRHRKGVQTLTQNNKVNGNGIILINNYLKCKCVECPNQKTKTG